MMMMPKEDVSVARAKRGDGVRDGVLASAPVAMSSVLRQNDNHFALSQEKSLDSRSV